MALKPRVVVVGIGSIGRRHARLLDGRSDLEVEWCEYVLRDLDGLDVSEMRDYVKYLANKRLRVIGLNDLYEGFNEDVMPWIRAYSDDSLNATKSDFFEQKSRSYAKVTDANGFDDL